MVDISEADDLDPEVRDTIAVQMARLNTNLENQAKILVQSVRRPFWALLVVVVLAIGVGGRNEVLDNRREKRDKAEQVRDEKREAEEDREACRRTNVVRAQIIASFATSYRTIADEVAASPSSAETVARVSERSLAALRRDLPQVDCG